jgi:hypothetical protein
VSHLTVGDLLNERDAQIQALTKRVRVLEEALQLVSKDVRDDWLLCKVRSVLKGEK